MAKSSTKKRKVVVESNGEAHIVASFNNIIISLNPKIGTKIETFQRLGVDKVSNTRHFQYWSIEKIDLVLHHLLQMQYC